jgi:hypothetical protein
MYNWKKLAVLKNETAKKEGDKTLSEIEESAPEKV